MSSTPKLQLQPTQLEPAGGSLSTPRLPLGATPALQSPGVLQVSLEESPLQVALVLADALAGATSATAANMVAAAAAARSIFTRFTSGPL
jgi:hypothetical protein